MKQMTKQEARELMMVTMHEYVRLHIEDEEAYMRWIVDVPDDATMDDLRDLAEDDEDWKDIVQLFGRLLELE